VAALNQSQPIEHVDLPTTTHPDQSFVSHSPQTTEGIVQAFSPDQLLGVQEEVQLREQDFGNFQGP